MVTTCHLIYPRCSNNYYGFGAAHHVEQCKKAPTILNPNAFTCPGASGYPLAILFLLGAFFRALACLLLNYTNRDQQIKPKVSKMLMDWMGCASGKNGSKSMNKEDNNSVEMSSLSNLSVASSATSTDEPKLTHRKKESRHGSVDLV